MAAAKTRPPAKAVDRSLAAPGEIRSSSYARSSISLRGLEERPFNPRRIEQLLSVMDPDTQPRPVPAAGNRQVSGTSP